MRIIDQLAVLQAIDSELDVARRRYAEIQTELREPESLKQARVARDKAAAYVSEWRKIRQTREAAVVEQRQRIREQEKILYGGRIKDPREQIALQNNVEALKRHLSKLEDEVLEAMLALEEGEDALKTAEAALTKEENAWMEKKSALERERQDLIGRARMLKGRRDAEAAKLSDNVLQQYETLRKRHSGLAVAKIRHAHCGGCGASLPTATVQRAHGDELIPCPVCGRWLHG
ncbi:MAG: hypothetical protein GXP42_15995 [Chloroflexi bacterium]|nr:hypothetical protein [Chloroflexota bacterium]